MEVGKFYYACLKDIRGCNGSLDHTGNASFNYIYSYGSRANDRLILLYCINKKDSIFEVIEYYTGKRIGVFSHIESPQFPVESFKMNNICETRNYINNLPTLAIDIENIKEVDENFNNSFYANHSEEKEDEIIDAIEHVSQKGEASIKCTIDKMERILAFNEYENAYVDNAMYDMKHNIFYKDKMKALKKDN